jgi:glycosyltransferase involved in cell wall biosynthesis
MSTMQISIIIVHYHKIHFLLPLLDYLLTYINKNSDELIEIIVVDNYSSDSEKLKQVIHNYHDISGASNLVKFLFLNQNYGPSYARNRGVEAACGDYIQFLDEDDWFDPIKLSIQYKFALSHDCPSFVASKWARVSFESTWDVWSMISDHLPNFDTPTILSVIKSDGFVPLMAGLIKRISFMEVDGFREEMWLVEDVRFLIDLYQSHPHFEICQSDQPLFFYRIGQPNSLSTGSARTAFYHACYENASYVEQLLITKNLLTSENSITLTKIYGSLARFFFEHDQPKFYEILSHLRQFDPHYIPSGPKNLRFLSKYLGYEQAELVSLTYRSIKNLVQNLHLTNRV